MYAVSEIFLPRERFESISRMDSHDTELEYLTTGGGRVNGGSGNGETLLLERISLHPPLLSISLIVSNLSRNGGDTYGWRKKRAKRISCAHFLHHFSNASCFFRQAVSSIHSLLNRLSTRFSRSVAGPKRHSVIYFRYSNLKTCWFFVIPPRIYEDDHFSFRKNVLDINLGSGAINFQYSPFSNRFPMRLIRLFMMKIIRNNDPLEQQSSWISSDRFVICELLKRKKLDETLIEYPYC